MRKMRLVLIFVAAVMLFVTATSCEKTTEPKVTPGKMIRVPGGTFTMGNTRGVVDEYGDEYDDELPTHSVTLNTFYIGKYLVTQAEFSKYMQPGSPWKAKFGLGKNYPAYNVSWYAAIKYCNLRSIAEGLTPCYTLLGSTNPADWGEIPDDDYDPDISTWDEVICDFHANGYRLPTEAEWEYAARGATNNPDYLYSGSDDPDAVACYGNADEVGWGSRPVGSKAPNGLKIYDMSGNIEEWCWDWYHWRYYEDSPQDNPTGASQAESWERVARGGCWIFVEEACRVSKRSGNDPSNITLINGFRLCRSSID
ncbi:MAG: formylglycine-generating enzyme family protein [Candidatus Cloacimonadaceae bacterium]|jgi:formylglycine-generating enzyme required for sulfatase activity